MGTRQINLLSNDLRPTLVSHITIDEATTRKSLGLLLSRRIVGCGTETKTKTRLGPVDNTLKNKIIYRVQDSIPLGNRPSVAPQKSTRQNLRGRRRDASHPSCSDGPR